MKLSINAGASRASNADNLSDLLFSIPEQWLDQTLLIQRADGDPPLALHSWREVQQAVSRLACWMDKSGIRAGDRVGLLARNSPLWLICDFAILRLGAVTVPAYTNDPAPAICHQLRDAGCALLLVDPGITWRKVSALTTLPRLLTTEAEHHNTDPLPDTVSSIIQDPAFDDNLPPPPHREALATLIYTSGTTGISKGVMLSHDNILADITAGASAVEVTPQDRMLSFLPLSHAFERTIGHFLAVACGCQIAYAESVTSLKRDMPLMQPTIIITVPRLLEKLQTGVQQQLASKPAIIRRLFATAQHLGWQRHQGELAMLVWPWWWLLDRLTQRPIRQRLGGRLRLFVCGGAALATDCGRFITAAGIPLLPGYGMTESAPVASVNRLGDVDLASVGSPLPGVEVRIGDDNELLLRGRMIMQGYWKQEAVTAATIDQDGWLHSGDLARIDATGKIHITGRIKELIVLSNGENIPPLQIEQQLLRDPCISQAMVVGEGRPWLSALLVVDMEQFHQACPLDTRPVSENPNNLSDPAIHAWFRHRIGAALRGDLPHYMRIRDFTLLKQSWTQESGLLTPTLKLKRHAILSHYAEVIAAMYNSS
ncbi:MAG: long-chain fatty acid--CoA ligase [Mariprofundales bacterium]